MSDRMHARQLSEPEVPASSAPPQRALKIADEQLAYARLLDLGMKLGMLCLVITFGVYAMGLLRPVVPLEDLPKYWSLPVKQYLAATGVHAGWSWLGLIGTGDFLNFIGIAFLAGITIVCYLAIIPTLIRKRDTAFVWIAVAEVLVLVLAASGVLRGGGH
jgi:hypothetical protein